MNKIELTGRSDSHIDHLKSFSLSAEPSTARAFLEMRAAAAKEGLELSAFSAFRNFDSQKGIWNAKYSGQRTLYNQEGEILVFDTLSTEQLIFAILSWSALPGASRHHWGTDIDVVDTAAIPSNYDIKLLPDEYRNGGVFFGLHCWLEENMGRFGFFKPYRDYRGGVNAEPWHLSYAPVSKRLLGELSIDLIAEAISESDMLGKNEVLVRLPEIYETFVMTICE